MLRKTSLFLFILAFALTASAQEIWSLEKCINHAKLNNLNLKQAEIAISQSELTEKGNRMSRLPNLNASTNFGFQYGRNIDPTTNDFINTRLGFNNWSLDANLTAYNGGRISNSIKQSQFDVEAAKADAKNTFQSTALQIASAYLNVLLANEQVTIAEKALAQTNEQLDQMDKRIEAGTVPRADRLEILAQTARNEQTLITAQNTVDLNYLTLKNLLELEPDYDMQIESPGDVIAEPPSPEAYSLTTVYTQALNTQPSIKASEYRMKSAGLGVPIARANALPQVTIFASLDSRYSSVSNFPSDPYFDQLDKNFGQTIGAAVNIPIYNNHQTSINVENARLGIINSEVQYKQSKQQLKADVQTAIANAKAAETELAAAQKSLEAARAAYDNADKRHKLGAVNTLELTTAKTNLDTAELNLVRAKYDYVFRLKIIDFYLGRELKLK